MVWLFKIARYAKIDKSLNVNFFTEIGVFNSDDGLKATEIIPR